MTSVPVEKLKLHKMATKIIKSCLGRFSFVQAMVIQELTLSRRKVYFWIIKSYDTTEYIYCINSPIWYVLCTFVPVWFHFVLFYLLMLCCVVMKIIDI